MRCARWNIIAIGSLLACLVTGVAAIAQDKSAAPAQDKPADNMEVLREKMRADKKVVVASVLQLTEGEAKAFSETDFTEDLTKMDVPTLILHGDDDQIVPIGASAMPSSKIVKGATLKVYPGAPHGMCTTLKDKVNADLLAFIKG